MTMPAFFKRLWRPKWQHPDLKSLAAKDCFTLLDSDEFQASKDLIEKVWQTLGADTIKRRKRVPAFKQFRSENINSRPSLRHSPEPLITGLGIEIKKGFSRRSRSCKYCDGTGRAQQHTDVGFGTERCHYCSGSGTVSDYSDAYSIV